MKKYLLIALLALPLTSEAICFKAFPASGYGMNMKKAAEDLEAKSAEFCGPDDFNWSQKVSETTFSDAEEGAEKPIKATALYKCCSSW